MAIRILALGLAAVMLQVPGVVAPAPAGASDTKIDPGLLALPDDRVVDFWVTFVNKAELSTAARTPGWRNRGQAVVDGLQQTARNSQAGVVSLLTARGIKFDSYWIANTVKVSGAKSLMRQVAARREVERVVPDRTFDLPQPSPAAELDAGVVEWNIDAVNAPDVWDGLSVTGQGIVVANLDTGVQFDHPALVNQYRGNLGGTFDHNYNWYDPSNACGNPSIVPCDNNSHGTHTMGTMVGDDGSGLRGIGVAPGAKWIAVKGCESSSCSSSALLGGGQWLLAPTDLSGQNPRPELRPNVVNNSWGGGGGNIWFRDVVTAWVAAGIFPVFSNGNSGPSCGSAGSPADYAESYAVGAHNSSGGIASFSSRSATSGIMKPDIAAPGEGVRSSVPGNSYGSFSGTSMAAPHVAGAVALMWSAAPSLVSDVARTREILDETAVDIADLTCGGTSADNGVWGEGKLDALAAVLRSPRGPVGTISGVVVDEATGAPIVGAQVRSLGADTFPRITRTSTTGAFSQVLSVGNVHTEVTAFGYVGESADVVVVQNETTVAGFSLVSAPRHAFSGTVLDNEGAPVRGASVSITGAPVPVVTTDATGLFRFSNIPDGDYVVSVSAGPCLTGASRGLLLAGDAILDFVLGVRRDDFGYSCRPEVPAYIEAGAVLPMTGDDTYISVPLPFPFSYYGTSYSTAHVSTNGLVGLAYGSTVYFNGPIPSTAGPNGAIYAFWDDLYVDGSSSVRTATLGAEPNQRFVIEWRNVRFYSSQARFDVEAILDQRGGILLQYGRLYDDQLVRGASATIGLENETGTIGLAYSYNQPSLQGTASAVRFEAASAVGNVAPDAVADSTSTVAGRGVTLPVLANDRDPEGGSLDVTGVSDPAHGTASVGANDTVTYQPDLGFSGTEVFTYDLADGRGGTDRASVTVVVAPLANDDTGATVEDTAVTVQVLANDLNPQAGILSVSTVSLPAHGTAAIAGGAVRYTPHPDFNGSDTFSYTVSDGLGGSDQGTVTIAVSAVNDPPRAVNDTGQATQDGATVISVLLNDTDVDGDVLEIVAVSDPPHGSAGLNPDRTVTYRPDPGYIGADSFTYDIRDTLGVVSRATVSVTVQVPPTTTSTTTTTIPSSTTTSTTAPTTTTSTAPTTTTTRPPGAAAMRAPYSVWTQASPTPLDGIGTWVATANNPTAGAGQLSPDYLYGLSFGFASSSARGVVALTTGPAGKTAMLTVSGPTGSPQTLSVPFAWTADRFYFLFVHQLEPGNWGALVFDLTANTWHPIGALSVPVGWGRLSPSAMTTVSWQDAPAATCGAYPRADIVVHAPTAFIGGAAFDARFVQGGITGGACSSEHAIGPGGWIRYRTGTP